MLKVDVMPYRIEVMSLSEDLDTSGLGICNAVKKTFGIVLKSVRTKKVYTIDFKLSESEVDAIKRGLFADPITETASPKDVAFDWFVEVGYKPGVTDNVGKTSKSAIEKVIGRRLGENDGVYTSIVYLLSCDGVDREAIEKICTFCLGTNSSTGANPIINSIRIMSRDDMEGKDFETSLPVAGSEQKAIVAEYDLKVDDKELANLSKTNVWSLSLVEMKSIAEYFGRPEVVKERKRVGLGGNPTDAEMETLAQTWSEHCKHKIFNALIKYSDENGKEEIVDSIFNTFIKKPSRDIAAKLGWVVSSFDDNSGVVRFNERLNVADKIETHNAPCTLDPYGGAITGIVGVNRDPLGTGKGARLVANIFGLCFGSPFYDKPLSSGILHPAIVRDGVHKGLIDGGNQSGIPLGRGWELFDGRYAFRPLVYCGTIGTMPAEINGEPSHLKKADDGDLIVMVGGRVGKDGIHGATFSSAELHKGSPVQAVQIGDPITQKKMSDFLFEARDIGLYKCITDNGAGGLSSSVGEMAQYSNGCEIDLSKVPLKYPGLAPWEILLSEAQERMTLAVDQSKAKEILELSKQRDVEATVVGKFTDTGKFHVKYGGKTVAFIDMKFLHDGVPRLSLNAKWDKQANEEPVLKEPSDMSKTLEGMLARLNICSKEKRIRQYDHEVKGLSVIKPFVGKDNDVPSDATVFMLEYGSKEGLALAEGKNPFYSDIDTYHMVASVIDEAVRRIIAIGGKLPSKEDVFYGLDNFCWNMADLSSPDGEQKLAQLVRANKSLKDYCTAFGIPCISGKDSMKNVWRMKENVDGRDVERIISVPPTLLFSVRAKISDIGKLVTMDVKAPGDLIYAIGETKDELGGSEYYRMAGEENSGKALVGCNVPKVDAETAKSIYMKMSEAVDKELIHSIHTPTLGGLGVALAMTSFAGGYGIEVDLKNVPHTSSVGKNYKLLFSESNSRFVMTIPARNKKEFEKLMKGTPYQQIGEVRRDSRFILNGLDGSCIVDRDISKLKDAWKSTLR